MEVKKIIHQQKHLNEDEIDLLVIGYEEGKTTAELAEQLGCHRNTVSVALKKRGTKVSKSTAQKKLNAEEVAEMYKSGQTTYKIAAKFGVSRQAVTSCLKANGIDIRGRWGD
ncbi:MAG: hypothetical protein FWH08_00580 [Oscillospiraceae bacterium]|nr:hypothetical protein [Oscillospiraceae bacterium]